MVARLAALLVLGALSAELLYLAFANLLLPKRLAAQAESEGGNLELTQFRSYYPGDVRVAAVHFSNQRLGVDVRTGSLLGQFAVSGLLGGSLAFIWLHLADVRARAASPKALLVALAIDGESPVVAGAVSASLRGAPSAVRGLWVKRARIDLRALELGSLDLNGPMALSLINSGSTAGARRLDATLRFRDVHARPATANESALGITFAGEATVKGPSRQGGEPKVSVHSRLHWKTAQLAALFEGVPDFVSRNGELEVTLHWARGAVRSGSSFELRSEQLQTPPTPLAADGLLLHDVRAGVKPVADAPAGRGNEWACTLHSPAVELEFQAHRLRFAVDGTAQLVREGHHTQLQDGAVRAHRLMPTPGGSAPEQTIELNQVYASWSPSDGIDVSAVLAAEGGDASSLLALGHAPPSAAWMLHDLTGTPYQAQLKLHARQERVALEDIGLKAARSTANGSLCLGGVTPRGAFVVRRGGLSLGVTIDEQGARLALGVDTAWLPRTLQALGTCAGASPTEATSTRP